MTREFSFKFLNVLINFQIKLSKILDKTSEILLLKKKKNIFANLEDICKFESKILLLKLVQTLGKIEVRTIRNLSKIGKESIPISLSVFLMSVLYFKNRNFNKSLCLTLIEKFNMNNSINIFFWGGGKK